MRKPWLRKRPRSHTDAVDLRIGDLLDDPALRRALGLDVAAPPPVRPDGRTASMLRAGSFERAA